MLRPTAPRNAPGRSVSVSWRDLLAERIASHSKVGALDLVGWPAAWLVGWLAICHCNIKVQF